MTLSRLALATALAAGAGWQFLPAPPAVRADSHEIPNTGLADSATLVQLFNQWRSAAPRTMMLALGAFPGLSAENVSANGTVAIDAAAGKAVSRVDGLPAGDWELWLIDNAADGTTLPDARDRVVSVGRYRRTEDGGLAAEGDVPAGMTIDRAAVTRAGRKPATDGFVLLGSANLYERMRAGMVAGSDGGEAGLRRLIARGRSLFHGEAF